MQNLWGSELVFPEDVLYSPELLWIKIDGEKLRLGMCHLAVRAAKRLISVEISSGKGTRLKKGDRIGTVENTKVRWEIKSPISGEVLAVNPEMYGGKATTKIMKDAYGEGWLVELKKVSETESELKQLYRGGDSETEQWLQEQTKAIVPQLDSEEYAEN